VPGFQIQSHTQKTRKKLNNYTIPTTYCTINAQAAFLSTILVTFGLNPFPLFLSVAPLAPPLNPALPEQLVKSGLDLNYTLVAKWYHAWPQKIFFSVWSTGAQIYSIDTYFGNLRLWVLLWTYFERDIFFTENHLRIFNKVYSRNLVADLYIKTNLNDFSW
jgi:hypothetical protein